METGISRTTEAPAVDHDIFTDPALVRAKQDDPLFRFLFKHWQQLLFSVAAAALVFYLYSGYRQSQEDGLVRSAEVYFKVRDTLQDLKGSIQERDRQADSGSEKQKIDQIQVRIDEQKKLLEQRIDALADAKPPYNKFAHLYSGIYAAEQSDSEKVSKVLSGELWRSSTDMASGDRLFAELEALLLGRAMLDQPESLERGREILSKLASEGNFVSTAAAISLAKIAASEKERAEALQALLALQDRQPEQADLLSAELERLGS